MLILFSWAHILLCTMFSGLPLSFSLVVGGAGVLLLDVHPELLDVLELLAALPARVPLPVVDGVQVHLQGLGKSLFTFTHLFTFVSEDPLILEFSGCVEHIWSQAQGLPLRY